jgi:DNA-binding GntR family transcriptional regulator
VRIRPAPPLRSTTPSADPTPLYFTLKNVLISRLRSLEFPPGSRLPAERQLAGAYGVSRITVRQALDALAREGHLRRERGRHGGTFVCEGPEPEPRPSGSFESLFSSRNLKQIELRAFERRRGSAEVCEALHLPPESSVYYLETRIIADGGPIAHVRAFMPIAIGSRLRRRALKTRLLQEILLRTPGIKFAERRDQIEACLADSVVAQLLGLGVGRPLLKLTRTLLAPGDEPIYVSTLLIATERFTVVLNERCR